MSNRSALDAVVSACRKCQDEQCDHTVGWGGSPDEEGRTTLDAMIMDGPTHSVGSVAGLENIKDVIGVARAVMEHTDHTMLVGIRARQFALEMGFPYEDLHSDWSQKTHAKWLEADCQPNYWKNVVPDPQKSCGPYEPKALPSWGSKQNYNFLQRRVYPINRYNHDTIGVVVIDSVGRLASGTSTNGANHKIPGRVGDSPIAGAGSYVDQDVGGAAATGDGDVIMRYLLSFKTVELMRNGLKPEEAANKALEQVLKKYPKAQIGIVALDLEGNFGAACINVEEGFPFSIASKQHDPTILSVNCLA